MADQQGLRQASVRAATGTTLDYNGDFMALFALAGITSGDFNGQMLAWINLLLGTNYDNLPGAQAAFAIANNATNFSSVGTFNAVLDPLTLFSVDIDFRVPSAKGGTQPYGNNTDDGRLFRDPTNTTAGFVPSVSGVYVPVASAGIKRSDMGAWNYPSATVRNLWSRDMTNAAWVKSNTGADITAAKDQAGVDGTANAASSLLCVNANGTALQTITLASSTVIYQAMIKRLVGTGTISMTVDGGATYTDITSQIGAAYSLIWISQAAVTNPVIGFKMATPGDKIAVDFNQMLNPSNAAIILPNRQLVATTTATILNSQSRPSANNADAAPKTVITIAQGYFAAYWQGRTERTSGQFMMTGATSVFWSVQADGSVKFTANVGNAQTAAGVWKIGLDQVNKTACCFDSTGAIRVAANGSYGEGTGAGSTPTLDHFDVNTNGAGQNSGYGTTERYAISPNLMLTQAQLVQMTT